MKQKLILDVSHPMAVRSPKSTALQNFPSRILESAAARCCRTSTPVWRRHHNELKDPPSEQTQRLCRVETLARLMRGSTAVKTRFNRAYFALSFGVLTFTGCSGENAVSPSTISQIVTGDVSASLILQTVRQLPTMCPFQSATFQPNLTSFVAQPCGSASSLQLTLTMKVQPGADSTVTGTSDVIGTEAIGVCSPRPLQTLPVSLTFPVTGSTSNVVFGGTSATVESLSNQLANFRRTFSFAGTRRDTMVWGFRSSPPVAAFGA
ncbi:MAG TPA: hypothetical protein VGJ78_25020 [Vicinamibacterales bacterium]|jgi:hypothetical protein